MSEENLIKNFYLFGILPDEIDTIDFEQNFMGTDFFQIQILSKFPPNEEKTLINPNILISHSFPHGYSLISNSKDISTKNEFFHLNFKNLYSTSDDDERLYFTCCIFYEKMEKYFELINAQNKTKKLKIIDIGNVKARLKKIKLNLDDIYIPKLICISSYLPYPLQFRTILEKLISYSKRDKIFIPIEKEIENLILGIPFPKICSFYPTKRSDFCLESNIEFLLQDLNKCNYSTYKMKNIFVFKIEDILEIYSCILLEKPVLIFSQDKEKLTNIFHTFLNLIFPFIYQSPHSAILPDCNAGILETTKNFFFCIN